jgi:hypothetical protein
MILNQRSGNSEKPGRKAMKTIKFGVWVLAFACSAGAWGCGSVDGPNLLSFTQLFLGCCENDTGAAFNAVINDQAALDALWADHAIPGSAPAVDFGLYTVAASFTDGYCAGCCAGTACGAEADDFDVRISRATSGACVTVHVARLLPTELADCETPVNAQAHVIRLPKADCVDFEGTTVNAPVT